MYTIVCILPGNGFNGPLNYYRAALRSPIDKKVFNPIEVPTLIVWGVKDLALNRKLPELSRKYIKDCTIKYVDDASHWVQLDGCEEANKAVWDFIKAQNRPQGERTRGVFGKLKSDKVVLQKSLYMQGINEDDP